MFKLTEKQAREIFAQRPGRALDTQGQYTFQTLNSESPTIVGQRYNIASRTVRDVWNRKAWVLATRPDWTPEEIAASEVCNEDAEVADNAAVIPAVMRKRGRPCGAKNSRGLRGDLEAQVIVILFCPEMARMERLHRVAMVPLAMRWPAAIRGSFPPTQQMHGSLLPRLQLLLLGTRPSSKKLKGANLKRS